MEVGCVSSVAGCCEALAAVAAFSAGDAEGVDYALAWTEARVLHARPGGFNHTNKLVAEEIALLQLQNLSMQQVNIGAADCCACDLDDDIFWINDRWLWYFDYVVLDA